MKELSQAKIGILVDQYQNEYKGVIKNGKANGKGTKTYKDGRIYTGIFKDNKREGEGILIRPDGTKYIGIYKNDLQEGIGKNITKEGKILIGFYKDGKIIKGKSIMYYNEPNIEQMHLILNTKVIIKIIKGKEKVFFFWIMEIDMMENFKKINYVEKGNIFGMMGIYMKEDLKIMLKREEVN